MCMFIRIYLCLNICMRSCIYTTTNECLRSPSFHIYQIVLSSSIYSCLSGLRLSIFPCSYWPKVIYLSVLIYPRITFLPASTLALPRSPWVKAIELLRACQLGDDWSISSWRHDSQLPIIGSIVEERVRKREVATSCLIPCLINLIGHWCCYVD